MSLPKLTWRRSMPGWVLTALAGLCFVTPLFVRAVCQAYQIDLRPPERTALLAATAVVWFIAPFALLSSMGLQRGLLTSVGHAMGTFLRHPLSLLVSLLLFLIVWLLLELVISAFAWEQDWYKSLCIETLPHYLGAKHLKRPPEGVAFILDTISDGDVGRFHRASLLRGYSLIGALPLSLGNRLTDPFDPSVPSVNCFAWGSIKEPTPYLLFRTVCAAIVIYAILTILEREARWHARIAKLEA
jgi:hypothetical protein